MTNLHVACDSHCVDRKARLWIAQLYLTILYDRFYIGVIGYISLQYLGVWHECCEKGFDGSERVVAHDYKSWLDSWLRATHTVLDGDTPERWAKFVNGHRHRAIEIIIQVKPTAFFIGIENVYSDQAVTFLS